MRTTSSSATANANILILLMASTRHRRAMRPHDRERGIGVRHRFFAVDRVQTERAEHALRRRDVLRRRFTLPAVDHVPAVRKFLDVAMDRRRRPPETALRALEFFVVEILSQEAVKAAQFA